MGLITLMFISVIKQPCQPITPFICSFLEPGHANYVPPPVLRNKVLLEPSHAHSLRDCLGCFPYNSRAPKVLDRNHTPLNLKYVLSSPLNLKYVLSSPDQPPSQVQSSLPQLPCPPGPESTATVPSLPASGIRSLPPLLPLLDTLSWLLPR